MPRLKLADAKTAVPEVEEGGGRYFDELPEPSEFVPSGSTLLDLALGGGWALGRISQVYGDAATGKSLLGIEGLGNFARKFTEGTPYYRERESAFDVAHAETMGYPTERVDFRDYTMGLETIENFYEDLDATLDKVEGTKEPAFYCCDSLDAFPDEDEVETADKDIRKSSGVGKKSRLISQTFRLTAGRIAKTRMHLMFVSQIRTRIGATMGRKWEVTGGTALRFYASQRVHLRQKEMIKHDVKGVEVVLGIRVVAKNEKSKVGMPYREVEFPILFNYGIDDLTSCVEFLKQTGDLKRLGINPTKKGDWEQYIKDTNALGDDDYRAQMADVRRVTREVWDHINEIARERYIPSRPKYS